MKTSANKKRHELHFQVGDWVYVKLKPCRHKSLAKKLNKKGVEFSLLLAFSLRNGKRLSFWMDVWCGEEALFLPSLFALATNKEALVQICGTLPGKRGVGSLLCKAL